MSLSVLNGGGSGIQMELLWENASPTSEFAAQTIALDLSEYDLVCIIAARNYGEDGSRENRPILITEVGKRGVFTYSAEVNYIRNVQTVSVDGIQFGNGARYNTYGDTTTTTTNLALIPVQIYGIKGVTTNV